MSKPAAEHTPIDVGTLIAAALSPQKLAAVERHLDDCEDCRRKLDETIGAPWWEDAQAALSGVGNEINDHDEGAPTLSLALKSLLAPSDDPRMIGRIGSYEIMGVLGQGGMGVVFKGFDRSLNRYVAIKMLLPHLAASGAARQRFAREAQAAAAVVHDNVMAIHSVAQWRDVPYFVMPYRRGVSLQKRLRDEGPLQLAEILRIGLQTARGLAAAHAQGIVHRDVKPANILLAEGVERVTLMDFGLARAADDVSLTRTGTLAGTPQYMSPEQARGEAVDARSDLFSLGAVLYAMCTGHPPFRAESSYGILRKITDHEPGPIAEINPDVPSWLAALIAKLMAKSPQQRFGSAKETAELLETCLAHVQYPSTVPLPREAAALIHSAGRPRSSWKGVFAMSAAFASLLAAMMLWLGADPLGSRPDAASSNDPNVAVIAKANWFDSSQRPDSIPTDAVAPKTGAYVLLYVDRQPEKLKSLLEKLDKEFLLTASDTPPIRAQIEDGIWGSVCLLRIPPEELKKMVPAVPYKLVPAKPDADYRWHVNKDVEIALEYVPEKPPAELLEGAELHLVGCYTPGFKKPNKQVNVDVRPTGKPIVLVLTAYYEVHWTVNIHDDADVRAVILSGYFEQKLLSQDLGVPVFIRTYFPVASRHPKYKTARSESCFFAWEQDKQCYPHMKQVLLDMTGKSPVTFQGEYSGDSFLVDGVRGKL